MGASGRVEGKVVIVTGAAGGQGAAEVAWLAREGAHVIAADIVDDAPAYPAGAGEVVYRRLDVANAEGWRALVDEASELYGAVHGLVNNAGITHRARLGDVTLDDWNRVLGVNVTGALLGIQAVTPVMPRGGSIVNVGSVAALTAHYTVAYTTSKWALRGLSRVASMELGPLGIRVNTIHPGLHRDAHDGVGAAGVPGGVDPGCAARAIRDSPTTSHRSSASCSRTSRRT